MKPLPSPKAETSRPAAESIPSLPSSLPAANGTFSKSNRRVGPCPTQRAYPWLLCASTAAAAVFCLMYVTKPVIVTAGGESSGIESPNSKDIAKPAAAVGLMPSKGRLPGDNPADSSPATADPRSAAIRPPVTSSFEETNLRVQHILSAGAPGGHASRIDLEVPVLYQSRNLRWTPTEVAEARGLLARLTDYQEKSRQLRAEGVGLLDSWSSLVSRSLPADELRADSPSLPPNQSDNAGHAAGITTADAIRFEPTGK